MSAIAALTAHRRAWRRAATAATLLALAAAAGGCGSSSHADGTEADPATAIPASAPLYLGATVRPTGGLKSAALAAGSALTGQADPYERLLGALRTPGSPALSLSREVAPWLGPHAGLFLSSLSSAESLLSLVEGALSSSGRVSAIPFATGRLEGALVMDTTDASSARSFLATQARRAGAHARSYRGVSYEVTGDGLAFGLVGRFAVIGSQAGLREVIGATQGEATLARSPSYAKLAGKAPANALGHLYVNPQATAAGASPGESSGLLALLGSGSQADISLQPAAGSLTLDFDTLPASAATGGLLAPSGEASRAFGLLPGESWLAVGLGPLRHGLGADVSGLRALGSLLGAESSGPSTTLSLGSVLDGLLKPLAVLGAPSAKARAAYSSWMGAGGVFASGSSVLELKAGVVISSTDAARSRAAVAALGAALRAGGEEVTAARIAGTEAALQTRVSGLPLALDIAAGRSGSGQALFVLGLGEASVQAALAPSSTMSTAASSSAAASTLGEGVQPSLVLDVPTMLALLESIGLTEEPSLKAVLPYLRATSAVAGGGRSLSDGVERFKIALGLHGQTAATE